MPNNPRRFYVIDFETCDALDRLLYEVEDMAKGSTKAAEAAADALTSHDQLTSPAVRAGVALCRQMHGAKVPKKQRARMFTAAQSFAAPLADILKRIKAGERLAVVDGRAALKGAKGTHLGAKL